jgi:PBP1b-binding outer membrane lipoprotein LpoB
VRYRLTILTAAMFIAGCSSNTTNQSISDNQVPAAVQGAFYTEHPYAQMNSPNRVSNDDGSVSYKIPYTRPDGTKGSATYAQTGELQKDQ